MPYDLVTKDGITLRNIPDDVHPESDDIKGLVSQARASQAQQAAHTDRAAAQLAADKKTYDPTTGMSWGEKALANVGAGMDNLVEGARQVTGIGGRPSDADLVEKRAIDSHLADQTTGGTALQIAGEIAPTLVIPAGGFLKGAQAAVKGGTALARVASGAVPAAARTAEAVVPRLGTGAAVADSAIAGATSGALQPVVGDESRVLNTAVGGAAGAAVPIAVAGGKAVYGAITKDGAAGAAADALQRSIGAGQPVDDAIAKLNQPTAIPLSTAAALGNADLGMAERAARARDPATWLAHDEGQNRTAFDNIIGATANADDLAALRTARGQNWDANKAAAMGNVDPATFATELAATKAHLAQAQLSPAGQNQMRPILTEVDRQLTDLGPQFGPEHMAALRARMAGQVKGGPTALDPFATAPRTDPYYISMKKDIDGLLDRSTGGKWSDVIHGYAADSVPIDQAKASQAIRNAYVSPEGVSKRVELGDAPKVTQSNLATALQKGENEWGDQLAPGTRQSLLDTLDAIKKRDMLSTLKATGTAGGGSNTVMDAIASRAVPGDVGMVGGLINYARNAAKTKMQAALNDALQNPKQAIALLERKVAARQPLSNEEDYVLRALRGAPAPTGAVELSSQ